MFQAAEAIIPGPGSGSTKTAEKTSVSSSAAKNSSSLSAAAANHSTSQVNSIQSIELYLYLFQQHRQTLVYTDTG